MPALSLFQILRTYCEMHLLMAVGYGLFALAWRLARPRRTALWVRLAQGVFLLALMLPIASTLLPKQILWRPRAQLWMGGARSAAPYALVTATTRPDRPATGPESGMRLTLPLLEGTLSLLLLASLGCCVAALGRRRRLGRYLRAQHPWKRYRRVSVLLAGDAVAPFSAYWRGRAYIVLPVQWIGTPEGRLAFRHEATHHRRGDTRWTHGMEAAAALLAGNPAVQAFASQIDRLQEFACDESVVESGIAALDYGRGLFTVAQWSAGAQPLPAGARGLAAQAAPTFLRQRIERLLDDKPTASPLVGFLGAGILALGMAAAAFGLRSTVQDRRLTLPEARLLAAVPSGVPLEANEKVLARLNAYVGTPEGRAMVRRGLRRMPEYRRMIEEHLREYAIPEELLAIPLAESAFDNRAVSAGAHAAGIWQFIAGTARRYGLVVDGSHRDDRVLPERETLAAMRYLRDLYREFGDWRLAIKAYNEGEDHVRYLIRTAGTRDPWVLDGISAPENYLSGAIATMILLKNPSIVD